MTTGIRSLARIPAGLRVIASGVGLAFGGLLAWVALVGFILVTRAHGVQLEVVIWDTLWTPAAHDLVYESCGMKPSKGKSKPAGEMQLLFDGEADRIQCVSATLDIIQGTSYGTERGSENVSRHR